MAFLNQKKVSSLKIQDIMTKNVYLVTPDMTIKTIIDLLLSKGISGAPVIDNVTQRILTVVSEADLMKIAALNGVNDQLVKFLNQLPKTKDLVVISQRDAFAEIFKKFLTSPVRRVPVIDDQGMVLGIVSRRDIIKAFLTTLEP